MSRAQLGDRVLVHYTGRLDDGAIVDSSRRTRPLQFTLGHGHVISGLEGGVIGMRVGETRKIRILPEDAYGPHEIAKVLVVARDSFPVRHGPRLGKVLQMRLLNGHSLPVRITDISATRVTLDANHPLAGHGLTLEVKLIGIA